MTYEIKKSKEFEKDYRRELKNNRRKTFKEDLIQVIDLLKNGEPLPDRMFDHALHGALKNKRDCHIYPDLVLVYHVADNVITLARLGSHAQLGL